MWRCQQLLSGFLAKGHLPRVSRRSLMIRVIMKLNILIFDKFPEETRLLTSFIYGKYNLIQSCTTLKNVSAIRYHVMSKAILSFPTYLLLSTNLEKDSSMNEAEMKLYSMKCFIKLWPGIEMLSPFSHRFQSCNTDIGIPCCHIIPLCSPIFHELNFSQHEREILVM